MPMYYAPPPPSAFVATVNSKEECESQAQQGILSYATAGPFRYKVLLEDFWDWGYNDDDDEDDEE